MYWKKPNVDSFNRVAAPVKQSRGTVVIMPAAMSNKFRVIGFAAKFEVGSEVKALFCEQSASHHTAFVAQADGKYLADIYLLATTQLINLGIRNISGGEYCTVSNSEQFFSYRRDGQTGRMASLIWRK